MSIHKDFLNVKAERVECPANCKNDNRRRGSASLYPNGLVVCWFSGCPGVSGSGLPKTKDGKGTLWFPYSNRISPVLFTAKYSSHHLGDLEDRLASFYSQARAGDYLRYRPLVAWRNKFFCKRNGRPYGGECSIKNMAESNLLTVSKVQVAGSKNQTMVIYKAKDTSKKGKGSLHTDCTDEWIYLPEKVLIPALMGYEESTDLEKTYYENTGYIAPKQVEIHEFPSFEEMIARKKFNIEYDRNHIPGRIVEAYKVWQKEGEGVLVWNALHGEEIREINNTLAAAIYGSNWNYPARVGQWQDYLGPCPTKYVNLSDADREYKKLATEEEEVFDIFFAEL